LREISPCDMPFSSRILCMFSPNFFDNFFIIPSLSAIRLYRNDRIYYTNKSGASLSLFPPAAVSTRNSRLPPLNPRNAKTWPTRFRLWRKWNRKMRGGLVLRPPQLAGAEATPAPPSPSDSISAKGGSAPAKFWYLGS
jgi:hypothetical protein